MSDDNKLPEGWKPTWTHAEVGVLVEQGQVITQAFIDALAERIALVKRFRGQEL